VSRYSFPNADLAGLGNRSLDASLSQERAQLECQWLLVWSSALLQIGRYLVQHPLMEESKEYELVEYKPGTEEEIRERISYMRNHTCAEYGRPRLEVEAEIRARQGGDLPPSAEDDGEPPPENPPARPPRRGRRL
jgi:hypothetical protein